MGRCDRPGNDNESNERRIDMRYYIIGTDGNVHGEADTYAECEAIMGDVVSTLAERYGVEYVEELELEIVEGE